MTAAVPRQAGRVLLVGPAGRVLLFRGCNPGRPQDGWWWLTPGGGLAAGETSAQGARRELREETGLDLPVTGPVVLSRRAQFEFEGVCYDQREEFFLVRLESTVTIDTAGWNETERQAMGEHRWWSRDELRCTSDTVYPERLADLLDSLLAVPPRAARGREQK